MDKARGLTEGDAGKELLDDAPGMRLLEAPERHWEETGKCREGRKDSRQD